jgi:hypothetical protein
VIGEMLADPAQHGTSAYDMDFISSRRFRAAATSAD